MDKGDWQRLKQIVADALGEESPAARTALLTRECGEDLHLLREAESFLEQADTILGEGTDRLEECATAATTLIRRESVFLTGRRVGAYVIVRELGRGGMGTVYLAARADGYFEKEVAIKVLKPGSAGTNELLGRFRAERELLASLDHPNIAALFDAGTTDEGLPYFVMEYVPGTPITGYARKHRLTIRQRLELFLKICAAVETAHRRRVVHRDLKRGNILVNEEGEPKLLDFGIAKLLEENPAALTATGQQRLTPISASPEQARGEAVTTASDIYALGVLLYELLTGQTPHQFETSHPGLAEVEKVVCEQEPLPPSLAAQDTGTRHALRGDLDAIIQRAMRKDPAERYASVAELERDVRHYLAGEPVDARPSTFRYRMLRFAGRHAPSLGTLALVAMVLLAAFGAGWFLTRHETPPPPGPAAVTTPPPAEKILPKSIAVLPFDDFNAPDGSSYFADGVQDDILTDLAKAQDLKVISRSGASAYRHGVRDAREIRDDLKVAYMLEGSVRRLDDRVRVNVQLIDTESDVQVWAEQYDRKLDDLFALQSDVSQAIVAQLKVKLSAQEKAAIESRPTTDVQAYDLYLRARDSFVQYDYQKAVDLLNQAIARDPRFALAYCLLTDVHLYLYRFGNDRTPERLAKAKESADTASRLAPNLPESHLAKAQYYYNGLRDYEKAQAELASSPPSSTNQAKFFDLTALTERRLGHWKEALQHGEKASELDPHDPFIATALIQTYMSLRKYPEAEKLAERAVKQIPAREAPFWAMKGESILAQGDPARAETWLGKVPASSARIHTVLARAAYYRRDFEKALQEIATARTSNMAERGVDYDLFEATIYRCQGNFDKAHELFAKSVASLQAEIEKQPDDASLAIDLAWAYAGLGQKKDALLMAQRAVQLMPIWRDATEGPSYASMQAQVQLWVGEKDAAFTQLASLVSQPAGPTYGELKLDPAWDELRGDPRLAELLAQTSKPITFP